MFTIPIAIPQFPRSAHPSPSPFLPLPTSHIPTVYNLYNPNRITTMAFVSSSFVSLNKASAISSKCSSSFVAKNRAVAVVPRRHASVVSMVAEKPMYPDSSVLGLGKDVPSGLYIIASALALPLGCYSCYMSNIFTALSAESVNPQFIVGSLLVPISWGL